MSTDTMIRVENVHHTFQSDSPNPIRALRGVSLDIRRGEYVAIIGHNGSGKSTLGKHLNGLLLPTSGDVWVNGGNTKDLSRRLDIRSTVGMVFQTPDNQIVATVVEEDVAFGPENLGIPHEEIRARVNWALDLVGMQTKRKHAPHLLSGGEKQRIAIAGILAIKPRVLVLDESTALLDPVGRESVLQIMRRLNQEGISIIAITHNMSEAALADRVIVMQDGMIAMEGSPRQIFRDSARLAEMQLDIPEITQLAQRLHEHQSTFPQDALTVREFVDAFQSSWHPELGFRNETKSASRSVAGFRSSLPLIATDSEPPAPAISVRKLSHIYMQGTPFESAALNDIDCDICRGEIVGIIGRTGSGKSTLIQHFNGLMHPQRGSVQVLGYDLCDDQVDKRALRRRVGLVFQFPEAQLFERYVGDDIAYGPWQMGLRGEELRTRVREAMDAVGLDFSRFKDRLLPTMSAGERRRAALAGVLAIKPEILVLDEPTAGLDPRGHKDILARVMALKREWDMTLVIVSHNMEDIARLCDRVYVMDNGKIVFSGAPSQVFASPKRLMELGLGVPDVTAAIHALRENGFGVSGDVLTVEQAEVEILHSAAFAMAPCAD